MTAFHVYGCTAENCPHCAALEASVEASNADYAAGRSRCFDNVEDFLADLTSMEEDA